MSEWITVSVVYATQNQPIMRDFRLPTDSTVANVLTMIRASGDFPSDEDLPWSYAIFGQRAEPSTPLYDGDRVELLLPLRCDPKENRRHRARPKPVR
ncbi:MAG: RnfH family protein [Burkholderiales bacterium]|nr:RnfH family protein [Burkholderiales bacterium]